jgi:DNA-binding response OmpR family regulator
VALLLVEDNARLSASLKRGLSEAGFAVDAVTRGGRALEHVAAHHVDAVILDLGLPDIDGLEVLTRFRASGTAVPVIVLTARDAVESRVAALDRGADDYLIKPFVFAELLARLRALSRRASGPRWSSLVFGDIRLGPDALDVHAGSRVVVLTPRERGLLEVLVRRGGDTCTRREILRDVFGYDFEPGTNLVEVHVAHLRRKLGDMRARIETVRGAGYRLAMIDGAGDGA